MFWVPHTENVHFAVKPSEAEASSKMCIFCMGNPKTSRNQDLNPQEPMGTLPIGSLGGSGLGYSSQGSGQEQKPSIMWKMIELRSIDFPHDWGVLDLVFAYIIY